MSNIGLRSHDHGRASDGGAAIRPEQVHDVHHVGTGGYDTIQNAHDALPNDGAGAVYVTESYDPTNETYPITWTKRAGLVSNGSKRIGDTGETSAAILKVSKGTDGKNRPPGAWFRDLQIEGGNFCAEVENFRFTVWQNCHFTGAASDGIKFDQADTGAVNSHHVEACTAEQNGRDGFWVSPVAHAVELYNCTAQFNGRYGARLNNCTSSGITGGAYQENGEEGVYFNQVEAGYLRDAYLEANCDTAGNSEVYVGKPTGPSTVSIVGNYFNNQLGASSRDYAVVIDGGDRCQFRDNAVRSATDMVGFVSITDGVDNDVHENSNLDLEDNGTETLLGSDDAGTRTRSHGIVGAGTGGNDLATEAGAYNGDVGLDSGANTVGNGLLCTWDNGSGTWQPSDGGATF